MGQERLCFKPKVFIRAPLQLPIHQEILMEDYRQLRLLKTSNIRFLFWIKRTAFPIKNGFWIPYKLGVPKEEWVMGTKKKPEYILQNSLLLMFFHKLLCLLKEVQLPLSSICCRCCRCIAFDSCDKPSSFISKYYGDFLLWIANFQINTLFTVMLLRSQYFRTICGWW